MEQEQPQSIPVFEADLGASEQFIQLEQLLAQAYPKLVGLDGEEIYLPESIYKILRAVTPLLAQGKGVTLVPTEHYLTPPEAANFLNVSSPYLEQLLAQGQIPYTQVGIHRRLKVEDLLSYKQQRDQQRRNILTELIQDSQELGFYEADIISIEESN